MRIAVSGAHGTGKSTLIDEFLRVHPEFVHEPEPYTVMVEELGEEFSAEPSVDDFLRQLEFNIDRLKQHERGERVIYERCPTDFLAYIKCISPTHPLPRSAVLEYMTNLDLIVYLPIDDTIDVDEFPKLRNRVDRYLCEIYCEIGLGVTRVPNLYIAEATGTVEARLQTLEEALNKI